MSRRPIPPNTPRDRRPCSKRQLCDCAGPHRGDSRIGALAVVIAFVAAVPPIAYDGEPAFVVTPVDHVDTLIGTGTGGETVGEINNFPGAAVPFGMVEYSPDTVGNYAGYNYDNPRSTGFSMTHASVGCAAFGDISMLPTTTAIGSQPWNTWEKGPPTTTPRGGRARLLHRAVPRHRRDRRTHRHHPHRHRPVQVPAQRSARAVPRALRRIAGGQLSRDHPDRRGQHHDHRIGGQQQVSAARTTPTRCISR